MGYNNAKGRDGENECADFLQDIFTDDIVVRFGGIEFQKVVNSGDVGIVQSRKKFNKIEKAQRPVDQSPLYNVFIEVKKQACPNVWKDYEKAEDDAKHANKRFVFLYAIKQKRGEKGKRLVCMTPETFEYFMANGT